MKHSTSFLKAVWQILFIATLLNLAKSQCSAQTISITIQTAVTDVDNTTVLDDQGNTPEYVVIKNNTAGTIELVGWSLSDDPGTPNKWPFPSNASIAGGATKLIFASARNITSKEPYATNFRLPCGATVCLYQQTALRDQRTVTGTNCSPCTKVITTGTILSYVVPTASYSTLGTTWTTPNYQDGQWPRGVNCLGYDNDPICDNLILYSTFNRTNIDTTNRIIFDMSGPYLHNGSYATNAITIPVVGKVGDAAQFSGVGNTSIVTYADHPELNPGSASYTFGVWVFPQRTNPTNEVLFQKYDTSAATGYYLTKDAATGATFTITAPGLTVQARTTTALALNTWVHLLVVVDRANAQLLLYRNGVLADTKPIPSGLSISNVKPLVLAQSFGSSSSFQGLEDEFTIWGRALSSTEIGTIYTRSSQGYSFKTTVINVTGATINGGSPQITIPAGVTGLTVGMNVTGNSFQNGTTITQINDRIITISPAALTTGSSFTASGSSTANEPYKPCITTDVEDVMRNVNSSIYLRIPFNIPDASIVSSLQLSIKYDDGFIAYLNGTKVAERNAPVPPAWNSAATIDRPDASALTPELIDLSSFANLLVSGTGNVLAIHGLNSNANDSRFLICPELCYQERQPNSCYRTTNGREFWIAFPANAPDDISNPLKLSVCITGTSGTSGLVEAPFYSISVPFVIPAGGSITIPINVVLNLEKSDTIENKGLHITASQDVAVYGKTREDYTTDTFLGIPLTCLGSEYLVLGYKNLWMGYPDLNGSQFGIVATADNTRIVITPRKTTGLHPAGVPYSFYLNRGQTYLLRNTDADTTPDRDDLSGTEIISDQRIAVFGGHRCANINGPTFFCNTILEQILPVPSWSTEYCSTPLQTRIGPDTLCILAASNKTLVSIDGVPKALLDRGEIFETVESVARVITGDKPIMVAQYSNSSDYDSVTNSDPFQINLQPTRSWLGAYKICAPDAAQFGHSYVNVVADSLADLTSISISPAVFSVDGPHAMFGGRYYARCETTPGTTYTFTGKNFGLIQYGFDEYDACGNSGGMGFNDVFPPTFNSLPGDVTIFCTQSPVANGCFATLPDYIAQLGVSDDCCPLAQIRTTQSPEAGSLLAIGDYAVVLTATDCSGNTVRAVINVHVRQSFQQQAFPTAFPNPNLEKTIWGWNANPDHDQFCNFVEYALGMDPNTPNTESPAIQVSRTTDGGVGYLEISYRRRQNDPSILYIPQGSSNLADWTEGLGHFSLRSVEPDAMPGFDRVTERCLDSMTTLNRSYFLRLRVDWP